MVQPPYLASGCVLKEYHLEGLRWLSTLYENGLYGILADEMGLGKSIQVISLIAFLSTKNASNSHIIIAPLATVPNWMNEMTIWLPSARVILYHGAEDHHRKFFENNFLKRKDKQAPVMVTSYEIATMDRNVLEKFGRWS